MLGGSSFLHGALTFTRGDIEGSSTINDIGGMSRGDGDDYLQEQLATSFCTIGADIRPGK